MASLSQVEKYFFNPRMDIAEEDIAERRGVHELHRGALTERSVGGGGGRGERGRRGQKTGRALRRTLYSKLTQSQDSLPAVVGREHTFHGHTEHVLRRISKEGSFVDGDVEEHQGVKASSAYPALRGRQASGNRYASTPVLNNDSSVPTIPPLFREHASVPCDLNLVGKSRKPSIRRQSRLPSIMSQSHNGREAAEDGEDEDSDAEEEAQRTWDVRAQVDRDFANDEKRAESDVKTNWVLDGEIQKQFSDFERRKHNLTHTRHYFADDDPMTVIEKRLAEIQAMSKPKRDERSVLDMVPLEQRAIIVKYRDMTSAELKTIRRKGWRWRHLFVWAGKIIILLLGGFGDISKYFMEKDAKRMRVRRKMSIGDPSGPLVVNRASISLEMQIYLTTRPHVRDAKTIKQIRWLLRATKAFSHLFPAEMEAEVARHVGYEKYDEGRVLAYQGRYPDRFYYILGGRLALLRQYSLSTGVVTKSMGTLSKGHTTDPQEMEKNWMREDSLVAKGQVEVLLLDKKAFTFLQHTTIGPPVDFLRSLHLFAEFPVEKFVGSHDAIEYTYYGPGKIIVNDSNRTPWLHVVKSGTVKVVRLQSVVDSQTSNECRFSTPRIEQLGCGKTFSHADAMLGVQAKQRRLKQAIKKTKLPQIKNLSTAGNPFLVSLGLNNPVIYRGNNSAHSNHTENNSSHGSARFEREDEMSEKALSPVSGRPRSRRVPGGTLAMVNIPVRDDELNDDTDGDFNQHHLWLTREKTEFDSIYKTNKKKKDLAERKAYLVLDVLNAGDSFGLDNLLVEFAAEEGLDHLQPALASDPHGVSLLSDGSEVVKISKRFFLQHAANNTMLKVETMYKEYVSEEEARNMLYDRETWAQYKHALWQRMVAPIGHAR